MDAVEYIKITREICESNVCDSCPLGERSMYGIHECSIHPSYVGEKTAEQIYELIREVINE